MKYLFTLMIMIAMLAFTAAPVAAQKSSQDASPVGGTTIKPGEMKTNLDGVTVTNDKDSKKNATMTPKRGSSDSKTKVKLPRDTKGRVDDIDSSDTVDVGNGSEVTITGTGGTVNVGAGATVTVINTAPLGGGTPILVTTPSGVTVTVPAGSTSTINS